MLKQYNSGVARGQGGGQLPRAPPGGERQNPVKQSFKILYKEKFKKF